jgi:organic hydroperoxide reductase OsmC/OhrA
MQTLTKIRHSFNASLNWSEESYKGIIHSGERKQIVFSSPPEFGGTETEWSPEHLLAASISSCYATTFHHFAKLMKIKVSRFEINIIIDFEKEGIAPFSVTRYMIHPNIGFAGNPGQDVIDILLSKAKRYCIISNSIKAEGLVQPKIECKVS